MPSNTYNGHRMTSRVGIDPEKTAAIVRMMRFSGFGLGVLLIVVSVIVSVTGGGFEWSSYDETRSDETALSYEALALVAGIVFLVFPVALGFVFRSIAGERLYLNGTRLTIVSSGKEEPEELDLIRARARVRLSTIPGRSQEQRATTAGGGAYRPVLVLSRDSDDREFTIELANLQTRHMRADEEIRLLEGAIRFATEPGTQHAAGQLRTVGRWARLPVIREAAPDAIPASPEGAMSEPLPRTPVTSGVAADEIEIVGPKSG